MRTVSRTPLLCLLCVCALPRAFASTYHVSPNGDDAADGDRASPWKTIEKVNKTAAAGDTVVFLPGEYPGTLAPANDGREGAPITFRSERRFEARLRGGNPVIKLEGKSHLILDGFAVEPRAGQFMTAVKCRHLTIRNCRFDRAQRGWAALALKECEDVRFLNNVCQRYIGRQLLEPPRFTGHAFDANRCKRLVVEGNLIGKGGHGGASITFTEDLVVRRTVFNAGWGRALSIYRYCKRVLFEQNVITNSFDSGGSAGPASAMTPSECIWRRNLVVHNWGLPLGSGIWMKGKRPVSVFKHNRVYHNTFAFNLEGAWHAGQRRPELGDVNSDNTWQNNIFYHNDFTGSFAAFCTFAFPQFRPRRVLVNNAVMGDVPGRKVIVVFTSNKGAPGLKTYTLKEAEKTHGDMFIANREIAPKFVDPRRDDFRLAAGSPCIDAGEPLAKAVAAGHGRQIRVDDARWFYDGFGIPGEQGDLVFVGDRRSRARVVTAEREKGLLTVDRDLTWAAGDPVTLPYVGIAPDLGAMEHGARRAEWYRRITIPRGARWTRPTNGRAPLLTSDFEETSREQWGKLWNTDRKRQTKHARDKDAPAGGQYSLRTFATGNGATLAVDVEPWLWEIDRHPRVRFSYRIPKGVPVGIWLRTFDVKTFTDPWMSPPRFCIGGSPAALAKISDRLGDRRLMDDGKWHTITIDVRDIRKVHSELRYLRAFDFRNARGKRNGLGKKGDRFWIDDFAILANGR